MRTLAAYVLAAVLIVLTAAACGPGTPAPDAGPVACVAAACPVGAFDAWDAGEPGDTAISCCQNGAPILACARPAGILTHDCAPTCKSGECAKSPKGTESCCNFDAIPPAVDPCGQPVP